MAGVEHFAAWLRSADPRSVDEIQREIDDELAFHLAMRTENHVRQGMTQAEGRSAAAERFGDYERIRKACRQTLLGERIMLQRLQTGLIVVLLLAVAAIGYQSYVAQESNRDALAALTEQLTRLGSIRGRLLSRVRPAPPEWAADRPRVVETFPTSGDTDVDPATTEIRVTFDNEMADRCWSWVRSSPESFPEATGDIHYLDGMKTCVMPVKLEPGTMYVVWINTAKFQQFKDREGRPAVPYLVTFTTRQ